MARGLASRARPLAAWWHARDFYALASASSCARGGFVSGRKCNFWGEMYVNVYLNLMVESCFALPIQRSRGHPGLRRPTLRPLRPSRRPA